MIQDFQMIELKSMKVIEDLALRTGPETEESMSTIVGQSEIVNTTRRKFTGNFVSKIARQKDFSIVSASNEARMEAKVRLGREPYRIEDIDPKYVIKYFENILASATIHDSDSLKEEEQEFSIGKVVVNEDGETATPADLIDSSDKPNFLEIKKRREKIALCLKKLNTKGKKFQTHMMSLIISYERAKKANNVTDCKFRYVKDSTYQISSNGTLLRDMDNKLVLIRNDGLNRKAIDFINGEDINDSAYKAYKELLWLCSEEGIDLSLENPLDYDEAFIDELIITRVTKNREYLNRKYLPSTAKRLRDISVTDYIETVRIGKSKILKREDYIENKITEFRDRTAITFLNRSLPVVRPAIQQYLSRQARLTGDTLIRVSKYKSMNDILIDKNGNYLEIDVSHLLTNDCMFAKSKALVHVKGFLILIDNYPYEEHLRYLPIQVALEYTCEIEKAIVKFGYVNSNRNFAISQAKEKITHLDISGNRTFGSWNIL